ncbi:MULTISPECIES: glycosyltransferase family 2 protein [unclassified Empedobacter]|uniref:glycosyltransferase family 2 protein n=1 Tax=unclassified Empedobacter TaxID=2643773 RepID=UPI0025C29CA8|nr:MULTISPECIES: glycosyltransferase [unclassified Empedobacter]
MQQPLISVIVPCYNQSIYMDECLQSVLDQTYQNWKCIIVNDGTITQKNLNVVEVFFYKD